MALAACDRFIQLHPAHANLDYILLPEGLDPLQRRQSLTRWTGQDLSKRDPRASRGRSSIGELIKRWIASMADDARKKMIILVGCAGSQRNACGALLRGSARPIWRSRPTAPRPPSGNSQTRRTWEEAWRRCTPLTPSWISPLADDSPPCWRQLPEQPLPENPVGVSGHAVVSFWR